MMTVCMPPLYYGKYVGVPVKEKYYGEYNTDVNI